MMIAEIQSGAVLGIDGFGVTVEIDIVTGLPSFTIVGLPNAAVRESRERVGAAIRNNGFKLPQKRITVNLAPADVRKEGAAFDLPIAIGILRASGQIECDIPGGTIILGELALDGKLKPVRGVLPIACFARDSGAGCVFVPEANGREAGSVKGVGVAACRNLMEVLDILRGRVSPRRPEICGVSEAAEFETDFSHVLGQHVAKRALQVAAAGGHHALMVGSPGSGKTMMARTLPSILPPLDDDEAVENAKIMSVTGGLDGYGIPRTRPFRAPHHSASDAGLVGGGRSASPGEITLAHNGVLFLDELTEFHRNVLETLRQPIEEGSIAISRANVCIRYPARFQLVAAMNPCPCGYFGGAGRLCRCSAPQVKRYLSKVSGPLLDRIAIYIPVRAVDPVEIAGPAARAGESSASMRDAVVAAYEIQRERYEGFAGVRRNADAPLSLLEELGRIGGGATELLSSAQRKLEFSVRSRVNAIRVARTIADLEGSETVRERHVSEAVQYRVPQLLAE